MVMVLLQHHYKLAHAYAAFRVASIYRPLSITKVDPPVIGQRVFLKKTTKRRVGMLEKVAIKINAMVEGYRSGVENRYGA